jgi:hypothetical protein
MHQRLLPALFLCLSTIWIGAARADQPAEEQARPETNVDSSRAQGGGAAKELSWGEDYGQALSEAESQGKLLVVYFREPQTTAWSAQFDKGALSDGAVREGLSRCVLAKIPSSTTITVNGTQTRLIDHPAFVSLGRREGLVVVDTINKGTPTWQMVVRTVRLDGASASDATTVAAAVEAFLPSDQLAVRSQEWLTDYGAALEKARAEKKMLLAHFHQAEGDYYDQMFERSLSRPRILRKLGRFVLARLPVNAQIAAGGQPVKLLDHEAFAPMYRRNGLAIVDLASEGTNHYQHLVSAFPANQRRQYGEKDLDVILDLPRGTLTQRAMIYAVRMHPEAPQSTHGTFDPMLAQEAESHSQYQANIDNQGHHNWDSRFQRISSRLPGGMAAIEVVAESWPGEELVDAACECVHSWRQSSGHWDGVSRWHPLFGYDIKLGGRGVWYGTGIFGRP